MGEIFQVEEYPVVPMCDSSEDHADIHAGFSDVAIKYFKEKPYWGVLPNADIVTEMTGTCGDTMTIYLNIDKAIITDVKVLVLGCNGAMAAAMATADLVRGQSIINARAVDDAHVQHKLQEVPARKHHCIQLAVKTLQAALDTYVIV